MASLSIFDLGVSKIFEETDDHPRMRIKREAKPLAATWIVRLSAPWGDEASTRATAAERRAEPTSERPGGR